MGTINLNQNLSECVKSISNIGETIYQNICSGSVSVVPWGTADWFQALLLIIMLVAVFGIFGFIAWDIIKNR